MRVWSLTDNQAVHRLAAHDNSVTSLQFDDARIVSGGSDGRVKIWNLQTGALIRELSQPAEAVWRVAFEEERSVVLASRQGRTVMEVWDFAPPAESDGNGEPMSAPLSRDGSVGLAGKESDLAVDTGKGTGLGTSRDRPVDDEVLDRGRRIRVEDTTTHSGSGLGTSQENPGDNEVMDLGEDMQGPEGQAGSTAATTEPAAVEGEVEMGDAMDVESVVLD